jgi:hypothetical protein
MLIDRAKVDMEMLRPYFTDAEIEKALRGWAKATGHRVTEHMEGAEIGHRNKGKALREQREAAYEANQKKMREQSKAEKLAGLQERVVEASKKTGKSRKVRP